MKPLGLLAAAFAAWPALADTGAHLHPHGAGAWLPLALGASFAGAAFALWRARR